MKYSSKSNFAWESQVLCCCQVRAIRKRNPELTLQVLNPWALQIHIPFKSPPHTSQRSTPRQTCLYSIKLRMIMLREAFRGRLIPIAFILE